MRYSPGGRINLNPRRRHTTPIHYYLLPLHCGQRSLVGAAIGRPSATVLPAPTGRADAVCVSAIIHYSSFIIHWGRSQTVPFFAFPCVARGEANVVRCKTQRRTCVTRNVTVSTSPSNRTTPNFSGVLPGCVAVTVSTAPSTPDNRNMRIRRCPNAPLK